METFVKKIILGPSDPSLNDKGEETVILNETEITPSNGTHPLPSLNGFFHGFVASVSVIIVSELGDKTFFIAIILAMNHSKVFVLLGASVALILMTVLSAGLGVVSSVIPRVYVHYVSVALFIIFGLKMLKDGYSMTGKEAKEEYEMTQKSIDSRDSKFLKRTESSTESGMVTRRRSIVLMWVFLEAFIMTFLAEWGDRSQLTTIVLAARENAFGVIVGASVGHVACTLLAVLGGYVVAEKISVRIVTIIGGILFICFAIWAIISGPGSDEDSTVSTESTTAATVATWMTTTE